MGYVCAFCGGVVVGAGALFLYAASRLFPNSRWFS